MGIRGKTDETKIISKANEDRKEEENWTLLADDTRTYVENIKESTQLTRINV